MRKVTSKTVKAFLNGQSATEGNTMTDGQSLFLHGNRIAWKEGNILKTTLAGWNTPTTRERLNGLFSCMGLRNGYSQRNFGALYNDGTNIEEIDSNSIQIITL